RHGPLPTGLGGVIGDAVLRLPAMLLGGPLAGASRTTAAALTGTAALIALAFASGVGARGAAPTGRDADPDDERPDFFEGALVSLGFLYHGVLSLKGRLRRILILRRDPAAARPARPPGAA